MVVILPGNDVVMLHLVWYLGDDLEPLKCHTNVYQFLFILIKIISPWLMFCYFQNSSSS